MRKPGYLLIITLALLIIAGCSGQGNVQSDETAESTEAERLVAALEEVLELENQVIPELDKGGRQAAVAQIEKARLKWEPLKAQVLEFGVVNASRDYETSLANQTIVAQQGGTEEIKGTVAIGIGYLENIIADLESL